ncbi:hypothetical protein ES703_116064 [subsurface metagenome]
MKTAGTKISDQEYAFLQRYAKSKGSNINAILGNLVRGLTEGKAGPTQKESTTKIPLCPRCDHLLFYYFPRSEMACPNCGYYFEIEEPRWQQGKAPKI